MSLAAALRSALDPAVLFERAFDIEPLPWQCEYLRERRDTVVVKGRQVGASTAAGALAIWTAVYRAGSNSIVVSPSLKQSTEITTRARAGLRTLGIRLTQDSASMLRLANDSRIVSLPGTSRSVRGWHASLLILDEAGFLEEDTITAARALTATGGRTILQSTPGDEGGTFHELVQADDPTWAHFAIRSDSVPTISPEFLETQRRAMSIDAYQTEFELAFGKVGGASLFTSERIQSLILPEKPA